VVTCDRWLTEGGVEAGAGERGQTMGARLGEAAAAEAKLVEATAAEVMQIEATTMEAKVTEVAVPSISLRKLQVWNTRWAAWRWQDPDVPVIVRARF